MTTAHVIEMSVTVNDNPTQDYAHPDNHVQLTYEMTRAFKPFTSYNNNNNHYLLLFSVSLRVLLLLCICGGHPMVLLLKSKYFYKYKGKESNVPSKSFLYLLLKFEILPFIYSSQVVSISFRMTKLKRGLFISQLKLTGEHCNQ